MRIFGNSIFVAIFGAFAAWGVGYYYTGTTAGGYQALFLATVLSILEISLSFDNAVVNAVVLKRMTPLWQHRFLTWGIFFAVFVVRLVFPLLLVGIVANIGPIKALMMAATRPEEYAQIMLSAHVGIAAFGGVFLLMVALKYFFDENKEVHWLNIIETPVARMGRLPSLEIGITLIIIYLFSRMQIPSEQNNFLVFAICGLITYIAVDVLGSILEEKEDDQAKNSGVMVSEKAALGMFLYLQVLDASFSFDGVVGAFAISNNLFIIMIGLGVGAMFVRSMTVFLVEKGTLAEYRYLEHGAFYAIGALAMIMFLGTRYEIPEVVTGLLGVGLIGLSLWSSVLHKKKLVN